jgi:hypothetical protein
MTTVIPRKSRRGSPANRILGLTPRPRRAVFCISSSSGVSIRRYAISCSQQAARKAGKGAKRNAGKMAALGGVVAAASAIAAARKRRRPASE